MELWCNVLLDEGGRDWATATLELPVWRRVTEENEEARRIFAAVTVGETTLYCAVGTPVEERDTHGRRGVERLYLPTWMLDRFGVDGMGETVAEVQWISEEFFPEATRIVLRPHDSAFYHTDAKEELERALTRVGVIEKGGTIVVPLMELGGYEIAFDVVEAEPANIVLAQGDEVALEFEEALDASGGVVPVTGVAAAAPVAEVATGAAADFTEMLSLPVAAPVAPVGQILGSGEVRRMPDGRRWNPWRDGPWRGPV